MTARATTIVVVVVVVVVVALASVPLSTHAQPTTTEWRVADGLDLHGGDERCHECVEHCVHYRRKHMEHVFSDPRSEHHADIVALRDVEPLLDAARDLDVDASLCTLGAVWRYARLCLSDSECCARQCSRALSTWHAQFASPSCPQWTPGAANIHHSTRTADEHPQQQLLLLHDDDDGNHDDDDHDHNGRKKKQKKQQQQKKHTGA